MDNQLRLAGCEGMFAPDPMPRGTRKVAEVVAGFCRLERRRCDASFRRLADACCRCLRWFSVRWAWLRRNAPGMFVIFRTGPGPLIIRLGPKFAEHFAELFLIQSITVKTSTEKSPTLSTVVEASATEPEGSAPQSSQQAALSAPGRSLPPNPREAGCEKPPTSSRAAAGNGSGDWPSRAAEGEKPPLGAPGSSPEPPRRDPVSNPLPPGNDIDGLCSDCPPYGYPTDKTRCLPCPRMLQRDPHAAPQSLHQQRRTGPPLIPLGYCDQFREYIAVFWEKPLNPGDVGRANGAWMSLPPAEWLLALEDARKICEERRGRPKYQPMPVWHLLDRNWTRVAAAPPKPPAPEPGCPHCRGTGYVFDDPACEVARRCGCFGRAA